MAGTIDESKLTPAGIVDYLDRYIIGQDEAKKVVAIAVRNRYRRMSVSEEMRDEIMPKNIIMIGPTGVGKTEIARRLAKLVNAPFVKVEASKYTEVGYVGRDVESMIRDLAEVAVALVKKEHTRRVEEKARTAACRRILEMLLPGGEKSQPNAKFSPLKTIIKAVARSTGVPGFEGAPPPPKREAAVPDDEYQAAYERMKRMLDEGKLESRLVEIEVRDSQMPMVEVFSNQGMEEMGFNMQSLLGGLFPERKKRKTVTVAEARTILLNEEIARLVDMDAVVKEALVRAENNGIVFIDEIDKIAGAPETRGPDVSREGVQRDILPILEGTAVTTKYGQVRTDHVLFIAAGAFHVSKPSDLIPELQGRFPIRVELKKLAAGEFERILAEPRNSLIRQYEALFATEGVRLSFDASAVAEISRTAAELNTTLENIGARRLYTVCEKVLEELMFTVPASGLAEITVDARYVREHVGDVAGSKDLNKYFL